MDFKIDVKPTAYESAIAYAPFDEALDKIEKEGFTIISLPQNAKLRMEQGAGSDVSRNGNYVKEGVLYIPQKGNFLVRNSPILQDARKATQSHRENREFYVTQEQVDEALKDSVKFPEKDSEIPVKRFGENELVVYAIGGGDSKLAQAYGDFLKEAGINSMPTYSVGKDNVNKQNASFARQVWFGDLGGGSGLGGDDWGLNYGNGVRGVRLVSGEASAQKIADTEKSELYTVRSISDALKSVGIVNGLEGTILNALQRKN